jgi:RimJ/RimL family protein N-acetyltransferase
MEVRRIEAGEGQRLRALRLRALRDAPGAFRSRPELEEPFPAEEWERRGRGVLVAEDGGEWLGMAGLYVDPDLPAIANVWGVWVDPRARGRGAGRALMEAIVERARADGHRRLELTVTDHSPAAPALYESLGFRRTGVTVGGEAVMALAFLPPMPLETERLRLRFTTPGDFGPLLELQGREDVTRWLPWGPRDEAQVRKSLAWKIAATTIAADGDSFTLAIERKDTGAYAGDIGLFAVSHEHRGGELGYILHPDHHGQGFATEAAGPLLEVGFTCFGMRRIVARLEPRNLASARVLEKLGMRREAHFVENELLRGEWQSELVYAMLEAEWRALRASRGA